MARLLIKAEGLPIRTIELRMGVNRIGRAMEDNDFCIPHQTISSLHCEIVVTDDGVYLHDCESTNGSFLNGMPVKEAVWLVGGEELRLGDVELLVDNVDVDIYIPDYLQTPAAAAIAGPPMVLEDGTVCCSRHPGMPVIFRCLNCAEVLCWHCVQVLKRQGGVPLFLCKLCRRKCKRIRSKPRKAAKKRGFLDTLEETVRFKFGHDKDHLKK